MQRPGQHPPILALTVAASAALLPFSSAQAAQQSGRPQAGADEVQVQGTVVDHDSDEPVYGAAVSLARGPGTSGLGTRVTDEEGRFLFRNVPPGSYRLTVTIQGYRDMDHDLQVPSTGDLELVLPLSAAPIALAPIVVEVARSARARGESNIANPFLITREEIEARHPVTVTDILRSVPGGRIDNVPGLGKMLLLRGGCLPGIWIDGVRIQNVEGIDRVLSPNDIETIRVYHALELPVELGSDACGGVVIRTRTGSPPPGEDDGANDVGLMHRLGMAVGLFLLALVLVLR